MILVDGEPGGTVCAADRGLAYGDGLFETMRLQDSRVALLERHLARLEAGCSALGILWPGTDILTEDVARVAAAGREGVVKIIVTRGDGGRGYAPDLEALPRRIVGSYPLPRGIRSPANVGLCTTRLGHNPRLAGLKHLCRLEQVLAAREVHEAGWDEGLMTDQAGNVVEATRHNLFLIQDGALLTPRLDACGVAGIMRAMVMNAAAGLGLECQETVVPAGQLAAAEGALLTNSVSGIRCVGLLCGRSLETARWTDALRRAITAMGATWCDA